MSNSSQELSPLITVGMVTYNSARFIRVAIESVLAQSYTNLELIISDDASIDETWEIINSYKDSRICAYRNEININEYPNRNKVLSLAKGDYFIFIDGDDVLYPHGLEYMVRMLKAFPESAMALSMPPRPYFLYPYEISPEQIFLFDYLGKSITHFGFPYTLFRTSVLKEFGIPTSYISGDTFIKKQISLYYKSVLIPEGSAWWRKTPGQASSKLRTNLVGEIEAFCIKRHFLKHQDCPLNSTYKSKAWANLVGGFIRSVLKYHLVKFNFRKAYNVFKNCEVEIKDFRFLFKRTVDDYQYVGSALDPLTDISNHPYSTFLLDRSKLNDSL